MAMRRVSLLVVLVLVLGVALAACGGGSAKPASGKTYNITATEFAFAPNAYTGTVGQKISFKVNNKGTVDHNFVVLTADGSKELTSMVVAVGGTNTLEFTPDAPGEYQIDCNLPGHKEAGMVGKLTVK